MQRRIGKSLSALAALGLAATVACGSPAPPREIPPQAATQPGAPPPAAKPDLKKALNEPLPMRDQRPPWQVFFESNFYHETTEVCGRAWRSSMVLASTFLPHLFSEVAEEREANPMLKAKAARVEERREAHREAQARHNKRRR